MTSTNGSLKSFLYWETTTVDFLHHLDPGTAGFLAISPLPEYERERTEFGEMFAMEKLKSIFSYTADLVQTQPSPRLPQTPKTTSWLKTIQEHH